MQKKLFATEGKGGRNQAEPVNPIELDDTIRQDAHAHQAGQTQCLGNKEGEGGSWENKNQSGTKENEGQGKCGTGNPGKEGEGSQNEKTGAQKKKSKAETEPDYDGFYKKAREVGDLVLGFENPLIIHHLDCDGITSGAAARQAFRLKGKNAPTLMLKKLDDTSAKSIPTDKDLVFTDLGAGQLELVEAMPNPKKAIIDHHPPSKESVVPRIDCHDFGFDGARDACSATAAYFAFRHIGLSAELGIVGAVGDVQDRFGFEGLNKAMLGEAVEKGEVLRTKDLKLFGKVSRPLTQFLAYATEPVLPGLTGNEKACAVFLEKEGIHTHRDGKALRYYDLDVFERKKLASAIINHAYEKNVGEKLIQEMVGDVYLFPKEPEGSELREAYEFSTLLNACGRHGAAEVGIGACLHEQEAIEKARELLAEHRRSIRQGITHAKTGTVDAGPFYLLDGRGKIEDTVIGVVAGAYFSSGVLPRDKPIIALSVDENGALKASSRGSRELVEKGLDLGEVMKKSAEAVGGFGGGHVIAAGASFPNTPENLKTFLKKVKEIVEVQLQLR